MAARLTIWILLCGLVTCAAADGLIPPLTTDQAAQAQRIIEGFKVNPRGPFYRIRWFCNDGTDHPPSPPPCRERGGGHQHASLSDEALQLSRWNVDAGTILTGKSFDELFDAARDHWRLKELVLERFLEEVDRGWIYRRAYSYRGARQIEDEERAGLRFLTELLANPGWVSRHYLLANELVGVVPHGLPDSTVRRVRALAQSIANEDPRFQAIRSKIHSSPGVEDLTLVRSFLEDREPTPTVKPMLTELALLLEQQRTGRAVRLRLPEFQTKLAGTAVAPFIDRVVETLRGGDAARIFSAAAELSLEIRRRVEQSSNGANNLNLLDLNARLRDLGFETGAKLTGGTRREGLVRLADHIRYAAGAGLLSMRQFDALQSEIANILRQPVVAPDSYYASVHYLSRASEWCRATAAKDFGPLAQHYRAFEPVAGSLVDHVLRGSIALPLSSALETLSDDAHRAVGIQHSLFGSSSSGGVAALNPGMALGRLWIIHSPEEAAGAIDAQGIYVIPETVSDLKPMAGVLTLDSGNMLSHTQLLAANLGIPNARIPSSLLAALEPHVGAEILFAVTPQGVVVLREKARLTAEQREMLGADKAATPPQRIRLDTSRLDLTSTDIVTLSSLGREHSGVTVGPKAANLGQLSQDFPGRVAGGLVLPFGIYHRHIQRIPPGDTVPLVEQIRSAYARAEEMEGNATRAEIQQFIYPRLAEFRRKIQSMTLIPEFEAELLRRLQSDLESPDGGVGVFVRSDTNAEDLPEFTGAGLNLTVPNQVGARQIIQAIKDVWASPFTERAYEWRSRFLAGSERVYPSVILMRAVPADKSGVIATIDLETGDTHAITVNVSEGVSAVVDGGVAESLLLEPGGGVRLLHQARATYRKQCNPSGGFVNLPPVGGDYVLSESEIAQVRVLVAEVEAKYTPARTPLGEPLPWDIEFGFEKGQLRLFQIRPLVRQQHIRTVERLSQIGAQQETKRMTEVRLDEAI